MPNYDFKALSPIDFELLVRDLLQEELGIMLENFKRGPDSGIDLRYCPNKDHSLIVQCKHYAESSFAQLRRVIKEELEKVKKLDPERYIVATSLGLTPNNKDEIRKTKIGVESQHSTFQQHIYFISNCYGGKSE